MKNTSTDDEHGATKQVPEGLWQLAFHVLWPPNRWWKKIILVVVVIFVVLFAVWTPLPERTKTEIIDSLKGSKDISTDAAKKTVDPVVTQLKEKRQTQEPSHEGIQQHTEGDQSPAIVSGGDVNINIKVKDSKKKNE